jgi:hypothetical protein
MVFISDPLYESKMSSPPLDFTSLALIWYQSVGIFTLSSSCKLSKNRRWLPVDFQKLFGITANLLIFQECSGYTDVRAREVRLCYSGVVEMIIEYYGDGIASFYYGHIVQIIGHFVLAAFDRNAQYIQTTFTLALLHVLQYIFAFNNIQQYVPVIMQES